MRRICLLLPALLITGGCLSSPPKYLPAEPQPSAQPPAACADDFLKRSELLKLPATVMPRGAQPDKSTPLQFAITHSVNQPLDHVAHLTPFDNGWSSYAMNLKSEGAKSLSVHLAGLKLPAGTEIWLCSPDGGMRQGPYRSSDAPTGELWTPIVTGAEAWLEVLVHSNQRDELQATLVDVAGGFR